MPKKTTMPEPIRPEPIEILIVILRDRGLSVAAWPADEATAYRDAGGLMDGVHAVHQVRMAKATTAIWVSSARAATVWAGAAVRSFRGRQPAQSDSRSVRWTRAGSGGLPGVRGGRSESPGTLSEGCGVCVDAAGSCQAKNALLHTQEHA